MLVSVPIGGPTGNRSSQKQIGMAIKFSAAKPVYRHIGGDVGANNEDLQTVLNLSDEEMASLKDSGALG